MSGGGRIAPLVRHARRREHEAAAALAACRGAVEGCDARLAQLRGWRADYAGRLARRGGEGVPVVEFRDLHVFLARLDAGIEQACRELEARGVDLRRAEAAWLERRGRRRALEHVVEAQEREAALVRGRREQAALDEAARRVAGGHRQGPAAGGR